MQTFTPAEYLKIDIASNFGLDKLTWDERIAWFDENQNQLDDLIPQADAPALFFAGIQAWRQSQAGEPISYPISLDATASGAQVLAILVGCEPSAALCNVIDTGKREDFYTNIYKAMLEVIDEIAEERGLDKNLIPALTRQQVKDAVMPAFYGSKEEPKKAFGEGILLDVFNHTMATRTPGLWKLVEQMISLWQPNALVHEWVLPDNFHAVIKVMALVKEPFIFMGETHEVVSKVNMTKDKDVSLAANIVHSIDGFLVREMMRRCNFDASIQIQLIEDICFAKHGSSTIRPKDILTQKLWDHYQTTGFLSARILETLDRENLGLVDIEVIKELLGTLPADPFPVLSVHDCFRVHANNGNDLRRQYNRVLYELSKSTLIAGIASQILKRPVPLSKNQDFTDRILTSNYALS